MEIPASRNYHQGLGDHKTIALHMHVYPQGDPNCPVLSSRYCEDLYDSIYILRRSRTQDIAILAKKKQGQTGLNLLFTLCHVCLQSYSYLNPRQVPKTRVTFQFIWAIVQSGTIQQTSDQSQA